ncbi:cytochrome P450 [Cubamyces lactineus]|nr:cytochrome P450 [Cubamyces lactineus]
MALTVSWELIGIVVLSIVASVWQASRERRKLPPGPKGLPFLGNALDVPDTFLEKALYEWGKEYGDVMYLRLFRTPAIVLNSIESAKDILDKRSARNSDRPRMIFFGEMVGQAGSLPFLGYGDRFRKVRKWLYDGVNSKEKLQSYQQLQRRAVIILLRNLLQTPDRFMDHTHLYFAIILTEVLYGKKVDSLDHELVRVAERGIEESNNTGTPGGKLVDFIPILKHVPAWFPYAHFKRQAKIARQHVDLWLTFGYNLVRSEMALGTAQPCVLASVLSEYGGQPTALEELDIKGLATNVYGAGVETSRSTLQMFILHMARNPHVFRKAQEEMDRVVGVDRLPDFGDRDSLPYLKAILEEVYRWNPALPTGE